MASSRLCFTNESVLLPVAPHTVESNFLPLDRYREIVEGALFDRLCRPSFFGEVVEVAQRRVGETLKHLNPNTRTEEEFRRLIQVEACLLASKMEVQFSQTGILGVPGSCKTEEQN